MNSMLQKRIMTSLVLIPLLILAIFFAPPDLFLTILVSVFGACAYEGICILSPQFSKMQKGFFVIIIALSIMVMVPKAPVLAMAAAFFWLICLVFLISQKWRENLKKDLIASLILWMMLVPAGASAWFLRYGFSANTFLSILLVVFATDIGAYFTGKRFGKHKLAPTISPGKTIEGFVGGMAAALLVGALLSPYLTEHFLQSMMLSIVIALVGTWGDLFESVIKRVGNVKDSGKLLPGHGGMLDRIDSMLAVLPVVLAIKVLL